MDKYFHKLKEDYYLDSFGSIYEDIRLSSKIPILHQAVFLFRRIIFGAVALIGPS